MYIVWKILTAVKLYWLVSFYPVNVPISIYTALMPDLPNAGLCMKYSAPANFLKSQDTDSKCMYNGFVSRIPMYMHWKDSSDCE